MPQRRLGTGDIETPLSVHLSICPSFRPSHFIFTLTPQDTLMYFIGTVQVYTPCHGDVLYSFWCWWDIVCIFYEKNVPSLAMCPLGCGTYSISPWDSGNLYSISPPFPCSDFLSAPQCPFGAKLTHFVIFQLFPHDNLITPYWKPLREPFWNFNL